MSRHIKLNNSSVSDYFKAKALDKGWIKEEVIEKKASGDVNISDNLDVNISTLILQLKEAGLKDLAGELTDSFVYYKRAASGLYNVTKDEYNKLTHLAHPKGSTKLQNMNGDCVVEDTYDTQKALMSLLKEKKRVKKASDNRFFYYSQLKLNLNTAITNLSKIFNNIGLYISDNDEDFNVAARVISSIIKNIQILISNIDNFNQVDDKMNVPLETRKQEVLEKFNTFFNFLNNSTITKYNNLKTILNSILNKCLSGLKQEYNENKLDLNQEIESKNIDLENTKSKKNELSKSLDKISGVPSLINKLYNLINNYEESDDTVAVLNYIQKVKANYNNLKNKYINTDDENERNIIEDDAHIMANELDNGIKTWSSYE